MKRLCIGVLVGVMVILYAVPALALGYMDELFFASDWWAKDGSHGDFEVGYIGNYDQSTTRDGFNYNYAWHQGIGRRIVLAINGYYAANDLERFPLRNTINTTLKIGSPNIYFGIGWLSTKYQEGFWTPFRLNLGGRLGLNKLAKIVFGVESYFVAEEQLDVIKVKSLDKIEAGIELNPFQSLYLYGGLIKFVNSIPEKVEVPLENIFQAKAKFELEPFFVSSELYYPQNSLDSTVIGEVGINFFSLTFIGRLVSSIRDFNNRGVYTLGLRLNY
jgi:hypothetical protein